MKTDLPNQSDPLRTVNWRFLVAQFHIEHGLKLAPGEYDEGVARCEIFLRRRLRCRSSGEKRRLVDSASDLHAAFELYEDQNTRSKFLLEARVIAGDAVEEIASGLGVSAAAIAWYLNLFFDVVDRLHASDFILNQVIYGARLHDPDWNNYGWKLLGFLGGPEFLKKILQLNAGPSVEGLLQGLAIESELALAHNTMAALDQLSPSDRLATVQLIRIRGAQNEKAAEALADNGAAAALQGLLEAFPFKTIFSKSQVPYFDQGAVELRTDQLLAAGMGLPIPGWDEIKDVTYPEPSQS
jgi:hypothetical protein